MFGMQPLGIPNICFYDDHQILGIPLLLEYLMIIVMTMMMMIIVIIINNSRNDKHPGNPNNFLSLW